VSCCDRQKDCRINTALAHAATRRKIDISYQLAKTRYIASKKGKEVQRANGNYEKAKHCPFLAWGLRPKM